MSNHEKSIALMRWLSAICQRLDVAEHTYVVGGAVRNFVLKAPIKDLDIAIDSIRARRDSEWLARQIQMRIPVESNLTTNAYGVAILTVKGNWEVNGVSLKGEVLEIANARMESYGGEGGKGYKPHAVAEATIEEDLARREFSFNTLMWRLKDLASGPDKAEILDLMGCGLDDLRKGEMRCPGDNPVKTFSDDPTRIIRAIKFAIRYGFKLTPDTLAAVKVTKKSMASMPHNAITKLVIDVLELDFRKAVAMLQDLDLVVELQGIVKANRAAGETLSNWAGDRLVSENLTLMDIGLPCASWVTRTLRRVGVIGRFRAIMLSLSDSQAREWCNAVMQPGRVLPMDDLIRDFNLSGREIRRVDEALVQVLLDHPRWNVAQLERAVREILNAKS
jgi:tRNA nucleotidyltransferase/poly(A) polymerase